MSRVTARFIPLLVTVVSNPTNWKGTTMKRLLFVLPILLMTVMTGCKGSVEVEVDDNYTYTTFKFSESDMGDTLDTLLTTGVNPWLDTVAVDLRPGEIYVSGTKDGTPGNLTIQVWPQDGELMVQMTSVNIANSSITQDRINNFNTRMASALVNNRRDDNATLTETVITDSELSLTYQAPRRKRR